MVKSERHLTPRHSQQWNARLDSLNPLEAFYLQLAVSPGDDRDPREFMAKFLGEASLDAEIQSHIQRSDPATFVVYRRLVRNNFSRVVRAAMPRAAARLEENFDLLLAEYLLAWAPTSRYLRHVTEDFLTFWGELELEGVAPYLIELATLEAARVEVGAALTSPPSPEIELSLEAGLAFAESVRLFRFDHSVHRLPDDENDRSPPDRVPTFLLLYRNQDMVVSYLSLSESAYNVVLSLYEGCSLVQAVSRYQSEQGASVDPSFLAGTSKLLGDLALRGVITGVRACL